MRSDLELAIEYLPGLASLALWCNFADTDEDVIAFTDGRTIYAGGAYEKFSERERRFICLHEILHIALCHPFRFLTLEKQDVGFTPSLLNIAADAIINKSLENLTGLTAPSGAWTLEKVWEVLEKCEDAANSLSGKVSEFSYSYHVSSPTRKIANLSRSEFTSVSRWSCEELYYFLKALVNNFSEFVETLLLNYEKDTLGGDLLRLNGAGGRQSVSDENNGLEIEEKRIWQQRFSLLRGTMPELLNRLAGELPKTEVPWERVLRSLAQTVFQETERKNYSRPSRRWLALERDYFAYSGVSLPFLPETVKKRSSRLAVALDTSGSIDKSLLGRFLAEIVALCSYNQRNLVLLIGDLEVHQIVEIDWRDVARELAGLKYTGGGGTDFRPLIKAAANFTPDALIYLTDLYGETGDEPEFPVIWATHGIAGKAAWGEQVKLK